MLNLNEKQQKILVNSIITTAVLLSAFLAVEVISGLKSLSSEKDQVQNTITVQGKGELNATPDIANISFSVLETNTDQSKATDALNKKVSTIVDALKNAGIAEKDIKTSNYTIYPKYEYLKTGAISPDYYPSNQVLVGYEASESIDVKVRKIEDAGKIVSLLGGLKVTNLYGPNFANDKYDELVRDARDMAIKDAREQGKLLAKSLGVRLGKIVNYSEGGNYPIYYGKAEAMGMGGDSSSRPTPATLPTGENKITSSVTIIYEIK